MKRLITFSTMLACLCFVAHVEAGSVSGVVTYKGSVPKLRPIKMDRDRICLKHNQGEIVVPKTILLGENFEMGNIFVQVVSGLPKKDWPVPAEPFVVDQKGCMYDPAVFGVMINQEIKFLNPDGTSHNVHALPKINKEFNVSMPPFKTEMTKRFTKVETEPFRIKCDVHPWMVSHVFVLDHPFFTTTGIDGKFTLENLPDGEYVIEAWQQRLKPQRSKVTIKEGEPATLNFEFSRPDGK